MEIPRSVPHAPEQLDNKSDGPLARDLQTLLAELSQDRLLDRPDRLRERIEALDRLEAHLGDGSGQPSGAVRTIGAELLGRARTVQARLEAVNRDLYEAIRHEVQLGVRPGLLLQWATGPGRDVPADSRVNGDGYDFLDALVSGVLTFEQPAAEVASPPAEMVPYQPTPARHIFDLIGRTALTERDVLVDLGSGLGHVPLLASICTGARSIGVEREAAYVDCARRSAHALNLTNVMFIHQDARAADLSSGTVFYLYTPFTGTVLRSVLDLLRREAASRTVRVCTYGPCTPTIAEERWLEAVGTPQLDRPAIFRSRS